MLKPNLGHPAGLMSIPQQDMSKGSGYGGRRHEPPTNMPPSMSQPPPPLMTSNFPNQPLVGAMSQKPVATGVAANHYTAATSLANQNSGVNKVSSSTGPGHVTSTPSPDQPKEVQSSPAAVTSGDQEQQVTSTTLANTKEKTPMCLINELARFNKVTHQYTLVDEQGPAHKKTFYVKLQLGESEEYSASGPSIKKAQHAAASKALEETTYKHPTPKPQKSYGGREDYGFSVQDGLMLNNITPTVELNSLAMKRGEPAVYKNLDNRNSQPFPYNQPNYDFRGMYNQRYHYMRMPKTYYVSLKVGQREFIGEGNTRQAARHNAAAKALKMLNTLPMPEEDTKTENTTEAEKSTDVTEEQDELKSEISLVHELALKHNIPVVFDVIRESGPPHMKTFVTRCTVGNFQTEAEGHSKKISKKRAADLMLVELKKLPPLPPSLMRPKIKPTVAKKKTRNLIKADQKTDPSYGVGINPISRLIQIQQASKKKEPVYTLLAERGLPRRREFVMQVTVDDQSCTGVGPNKKLAKRHAAESMLQLLGYSKPSPQPAKPSIKSGQSPEAGEKKVTFVENSEESAGVMNGQSGVIVPGLLRLPEGNIHSGQTTATTYSQFKGMSNQYHAGGIVKGFSQPPPRPEFHLRDVATRHNIDIKFDEFSGKNNTNEFLSRVSVGSGPQHVLHGSGPTLEAARDAAALAALKVLAEMGVAVVKEDIVHAAGDGSQMKKGDKDRLANSKTVKLQE